MPNAGEERRVTQYELEREIVAHRIVVRRRLDVRVPEQRLDLGGEHHAPVVGTVVQRLDAEVIACGDEAAAVSIVQHEREHPVERPNEVQRHTPRTWRG